MYDSEVNMPRMTGTVIENGQCYIDGVRRAREACQSLEDFTIGMTIFGIIFMIIIFTFFVGLFALWIYTLVHAIQNEDVKERTLWIVLHFVGLNMLAAPIYYFAVLKPYNNSKKAKLKKSKTKNK